MELESTRVRDGECEQIDSLDRESRNHEKEELDSWNPMSDDYESQVFNSYKEPSVKDFVNSLPGNASQSSQLSTNSSLKSEEGDVRLFVGRIPQQMTREGLHNLFSQVGKLMCCKLIPQHHKDTNIGFLGYETVREAEAAIQKFDGFDLGQGARLKVALALAKQKPSFGFLEEAESVVNGVASNGVPESTQEPEPASSRQNETSIQDGVSASVKWNLPPTGSRSVAYPQDHQVKHHSQSPKQGNPCSFCGQLGLKWCSVCKIPYCSRDCQKNDWPKHKLVCLQQPPAERKTIKPGTHEEANAPLTTVPRDAAVQPTEHTKEQIDSPHVPPGDSLQSSEECITSTTPRVSDEETGPGSDDKFHERDPVKVDGFDVHNVERFAQMMGFDLNQVKFVEKKDSDDSDKSSSSSLDNIMAPEALSEVTMPALPREGSGQQTLATESQNSDNVGLEPVMPQTAAVLDQANPTPRQPSCAMGRKRFFIKQLAMESVPTEGFFEVVVTEVENPSCVWAHLCSPEALERQNQLKKHLQASYCDSVYENYVPSAGEVCVAQFSFDNCWYRVKVDIVNNTGTLRVTYIDFGNHEDIAVDKVRHISEDLVSFPRQALKLSLHGIASTSPSGKWSPEAATLVKSKVLGLNCKVQVSGQLNEILFVKLFDPKETNSDTTINDSLMEAGFAKTRVRQPSSPNSRQQSHPASQQSQSSPQHNAGLQHCGPQGSFDTSGRQPFHWSNSSQAQHSAGEQQVKSPPYQSSGSAPPPKEYSNSSRNSTRPAPFEAVINSVVNPWEFYAQKTDPHLLDKLNNLMQDLNQHMNATPYTPQSKASFSSGDVCAAKFSLDNLWYRANILEKLPRGFRVRYMDFGNSEVVEDGSVCPLPQQFQSFPALSLQCSLAGVRKPKGQEWSPEAVQQFKSLVAQKPFVCRIVHTHRVANIVELLDPKQNGDQTVANSLILSGLADAFIHKDGTKHLLDGKKGLSFTGPQQFSDGGAPVSKGPFDGTRKSPFSPLNPSSNIGGPRDRIESAVFEPAIQAAAIPPDSRLEVLVTEVVSPGLFYCGSVESHRKSAKLTEEMNQHYNSMSYPPFVAHENDLCAARYSQSGDWCRAFIKGNSPDGLVYVHYVDYGNTEFAPVDQLRPLLEQFNSNALPFSALRCSLANVSSLDLSGWCDEAMAFVKTLIPTFRCYGVHVVGRWRGKLFVDVTANETGESVSQALVRQGLARAMARGVRRDQQQHPSTAQRNQVRESGNQTLDNHTASPQRGEFERHNVNLLESVVFQPAIESATLPQDKSCFDVMLTEVTRSGLFFIQVADHDTAQHLKRLSDEMNAFYRSSPQPSTFHPQQKQLCAALYTETGDWCRAFVKEVTPESLVDVHYVDFGNTEKLSMSSIKPLDDKFTKAPFFALHCSLANIAQPEPPGWPVQAMKLIEEKVPLFTRASCKVLGKRRGMLFIDFVISKNLPQSLSQLLVNEGFAQRSMRGDTQREYQGPRNSSSQQSESSTSSTRQTADLEAHVFEPAIQSVAGATPSSVPAAPAHAPAPHTSTPAGSAPAVPAHIPAPHTSTPADSSPAVLAHALAPHTSTPADSAPAIPSSPSAAATHATHIGASATHASDSRVYASTLPLVEVPLGTSCQVLISEVQRPDKIFFQVLNQENAQGLVALSEMLNSHCSAVDNSPYRPVLGELCCTQFTVDNSWYRAAVQDVSESRMKVVFVDYGNEDEVAVDSIRRMTPSFTQLPIQARECFLEGIQPASGSSWSTEAVNFLNERLLAHPPRPFFAKIDSTERSRCPLGVELFEVDPSIQPGISINKDMIQRGLAQIQDHAVCTALPMIVPDVDQFDIVVTEVVHPGEIWAQVLDADARNSLSSLMEQINQYCVNATMPTSTLQPGQECCAQFSQDGSWYRARVLECPSPAQLAVQYVDFGNSELLTPDKTRPMKDEFFKLPAQALKLSLANIRPAHQVWNQEAVIWLKVILNRELKAKVIHRLPEHLVVSLEDWTVPDGPINISEMLVANGHAVSS